MKHKDILSIQEREKTATITKQWVRLTRACNNRCIFCLDSEAQNGSCIPYKSIEAELKKGILSKKRRAVLSGGEPTIHPRFLEIVALAKKIGYAQIQVMTNGRMFSYKDFLDRAILSGVTEITFSFHGDNPRLHDSQTNLRGSFKQSLQGLVNALRTRKVIVDIDVVINRSNVRYLKRILGFFSQMGIKEFDLLQVIPFGSAWKNKKKVFYQIKNNLKYLKKAFDFALINRLIVWTNRFPAFYLDGYEYLIQHPYKLTDEIEGRKNLFKLFLKTGKPLYCSGKRCAFCYLKDFCDDLSFFKKNSKLSSKKMPLCLDAKVLAYRGGKSMILTKETDILKFLEFFLENRYFTKAQNCIYCKYYKTCDGISVYDAKRIGLGVLKPLK